jgi:hypothetical protein
MKAHGLIERIGRAYSYRLSDKGIKAALMFILFQWQLRAPPANPNAPSSARPDTTPIITVRCYTSEVLVPDETTRHWPWNNVRQRPADALVSGA